MIQKKINSLSVDEDYRQDLWLRYLEDPSADISSNLIEIQINAEINDLIITKIITLLRIPPAAETLNLLNNFSELERSVMILLLLGLTKEQISKYKMIEMLRLQQLINNISIHPAWETFFAKEKTKL
jgi:hypothetical protein